MSDESQEKQPYLTFSFAGIQIKFGGKEILSIMIATVVGGPIIAGLYLHDRKADERYITIESAIKDAADAADATNYILTLSQDDREKLNLSVPKRIREMSANRDRNWK